MGELLGPDDPEPVRLHNTRGPSPFLLLGDHAGRLIPRALNDLGLTGPDLDRHIAWDIGVAGLGLALAERLDAAFVSQIYSRLVIDSNRDPGRADAVPEVSDGTTIPANAKLDPAARAERVAGIHAPYQDAIADQIAARTAAGRRTVLVSLHSFTPRMAGFDRPWQAGVLHDGANDAFARAMLDVMRAEPGLTIGDNEPYRMDTVDHTVPRHAFHAGLPYVELEVRQDLIADDAGVAVWADRLARWLPAALPNAGEAV